MRRQEVLDVTELMVEEMVGYTDYPAKSYWLSVLESVQELKSGEYEEDAPFGVYMCIKDLPIAPQFLDSFGKEIGEVAGFITSTTQDILEKL